jgi:hypothetical protein
MTQCCLQFHTRHFSDDSIQMQYYFRGHPVTVCATSSQRRSSVFEVGADGNRVNLECRPFRLGGFRCFLLCPTSLLGRNDPSPCRCGECTFLPHRSGPRTVR